MQLLSITTALSALGFALVLGASDASAQCMSDRLWSSNGTGGDIFGRSLGLSGDTLLVGASRTDRSAMNSVGSVYRFERTPNGFVEVEEWNAFDMAQQDEFGENLSIDGDWAVVGSRWADVNGTNSGAAYIWQRVGTNWIAGPKLIGSQTDDNDNFGNAVSVSDGPTPRMAIGAEWHGNGTWVSGGAVYIYEYDSNTSQWNEVQLLRSDDISVGDFFGRIVILDGDRLIVSATSAPAGAGSAAGAVYVFQHDGTQFVQAHKLLGSDVGGFDNFGKKVALDGDRLVAVGTKPYVFDFDGTNWTEEAILTNSSGEANWGNAVAVSGDRIVATKYFFGTGGLAWHYERVGTSWVETHTTHEQSAGDYYGRDALFDGDDVLISADSANVNGGGLTAGEVYAYPLAGPDCNANGIADACDIFSGTSADVDADGVPDECAGGPQNYCTSTANSTGSAAVISMVGSTSVGANNFTLNAGPVPNTPGLFFYGVNQEDVPLGNGRLCVGGPQIRLVVVTGSGNQSTYTYDLTTPPVPAGQITAGSTWNFQLWFRDPGMGSGFDLSNGLTVPFTP